MTAESEVKKVNNDGKEGKKEVLSEKKKRLDLAFSNIPGIRAPERIVKKSLIFGY